MRASLRWLVLIVLLLAAACHRPSRKRFTDQLASVGSRLAAVVKSGAVKVDANVAMKAAAQTPPPARQRVREDEPPPAQPDPQQAAPRPAAPSPDIQVTRVDAARPTVWVLRGQTHAGKDFCEQHATKDACTSACTAMLRPNMFTKPGPSSPKGCTCGDAEAGC